MNAMVFEGSTIFASVDDVVLRFEYGTSQNRSSGLLCCLSMKVND